MKISSKGLFLLAIAFLCLCQSSNIRRTLAWDDPACSQWNSDGTVCNKCSTRYYYDSAKKLCQHVSDLCATWDDSNGNCLTCYVGYSGPVDGKCGNDNGNDTNVGSGNDDPYCQCRNDDKTCNKCYAGYILKDGICIEDLCANYGYLDNNGLQFAALSIECSCQHRCKECKAGYYLDANYQCQKLPGNCLQADKNGKCIKCNDGYLPNTAGVCVEIIISTPDNNCTTYGYVDSKGNWLDDVAQGCKKVCKECKAGFWLDKNYKCQPYPGNCNKVDANGKCTQCNAGYYLASDCTCKKLPSNCQTVDKNDKCTKCNDGYLPNAAGVCVEIIISTPDDNCSTYGYVDSKGNWLADVAQGCKKVCKVCKSGFWLDKNYKCQPYPGNCKNVDASGKCTQCNAGYYLASDCTCKKLPSNCQAADKNDKCTKCNDGYQINSKGQCQKCAN